MKVCLPGQNEEKHGHSKVGCSHIQPYFQRERVEERKELQHRHVSGDMGQHNVSLGASVSVMWRQPRVRGDYSVCWRVSFFLRNLVRMVGWVQTWVRLKFFDSIQLSLRMFWFWLNSWLTMTFQELIQINSRLELAFWNLIQIDSWLKWLPRIWIQIDSRLKWPSRILIQINLRLKKISRILIQILSWLKKNFLECWFE